MSTTLSATADSMGRAKTEANIHTGERATTQMCAVFSASDIAKENVSGFHSVYWQLIRNSCKKTLGRKVFSSYHGERQLNILENIFKHLIQS